MTERTKTVDRAQRKLLKKYPKLTIGQLADLHNEMLAAFDVGWEAGYERGFIRGEHKRKA